MERRTCKLCSKSFANGRALGGHMRSHMAALAPAPKIEQQNESSSPSSSSSSSLKQDQDDDEEEEEEVEEEDEESKSQCYGLRENPKKSFRLVDPEFSFAVDAGSIVQDRESETESSKNPNRKRSKRNWSWGHKLEPDQEPVSSVSDTTPEEDVAISLMMLSRDIWMSEKKKKKKKKKNEEIVEESDSSDEELKLNDRGGGGGGSRRKYQCGTCRKVFASYQALGGHRASHKKIKGYRSSTTTITITLASKLQESDSETKLDNRKTHQCPVCFRVFGSGQALGGHKRSHLSVSVSASATVTTNIGSTKFGDNLIDLNLPAPVDDDDFSQVEFSAVSDAEMDGRD